MHNSTAQNWIEDFHQRQGRAPRILHIGNVAGNAYQNAKMLNAAGADCDVLCADYYHTMGSPEWDDADFGGDIGNPNYPAWQRVDLHGFVRPRWFIQAPRRMAIAYLLARRTGDDAGAERLWQSSRRVMRYYSFREASFLKKPLLLLEKLAFACMALLRRLSGGKASEAPVAKQTEDPLLARLNRDAAQLFPERNIHFEAGWDSPYTPGQAALYAPLFAHYDIVQGYATDCVWPYLCGFENYTAYSHGTVREFPRENTATAHLALLAYARAKAITITNVDCYDIARSIAKPANTPLICGLHGINMARVLQKMDEMAPTLGPEDRFGLSQGLPVFFCPSRHTWDESRNGFLKGEDKAIRAAARLAGEGADFRLVLARWGDDVDKIEALLAGLPQLKDKIHWTPPLSKSAFYRAFLAVDAVLDQFLLQVYGGIAFETLCAGHAALLSAAPPSPDVVLEFFPRLLPYYACEGEDDIYAAMQTVVQRPAEAKALAAQGRQWILDCHSSAQIVAKNCLAFSHVL